MSDNVFASKQDGSITDPATWGIEGSGFTIKNCTFATNQDVFVHNHHGDEDPGYNEPLGLPEYMKHVRHTHASMSGRTWCGAALGAFEWSFVDLDHAAYNAMQGGRLVACRACVEAAVKALLQTEAADNLPKPNQMTSRADNSGCS